MPLPREDEPKREEKPKKWNLRLLMMLALLLTGVLLLIFTPIVTYLKDISFMQGLVADAGIWGYLVYIGLFVVLGLLNIPCTFLMAIAVLIYGTWPAIILTYIAGVCSALATFFVGRLIGAGSLEGIKSGVIKRLVAGAESYPYRTIFVLRSLMQFSPLVGYGLALTRIRSSAYILANILGIFIPVTYLGLAFFLLRETVLIWLGVSG